MEKKCPYCGKEMVLGYLQSWDGLAWNQKPAAIAALAYSKRDALRLAPPVGLYSNGEVEAYRCSVCRILLLSYTEE